MKPVQITAFLLSALGWLLSSCSSGAEDPISYYTPTAVPDSITFVDIPDTVLRVISDSVYLASYQIDLDGDSQNDVEFNLEYIHSNCTFTSHVNFSTTVRTLHSDASLLLKNNTPPWGNTVSLISGDSILQQLPTDYYWGDEGGIYYYSCSYNTQGHTFNGINEYLPVRLRKGTDIHLGWIRLHQDGWVTTSSSPDAGYMEFTIRSWAYNNTPGNNIIAGQTQ
ncbi:MAG: hypothetical protein H6581_05875 [Bacteroidia bacterium]|nr:hypothetical protein [Bacteroidia bacterium]